MKLTDIQKKQIEEELAAFTNEYVGKTKEERKEKGQFFTPASLVIEMLEMFALRIHFNKLIKCYFSIIIFHFSISPYYI